MITNHDVHNTQFTNKRFWVKKICTKSEMNDDDHYDSITQHTWMMMTLKMKILDANSSENFRDKEFSAMSASWFFSQRVNHSIL